MEDCERRSFGSYDAQQSLQVIRLEDAWGNSNLSHENTVRRYHAVQLYVTSDSAECEWSVLSVGAAVRRGRSAGLGRQQSLTLTTNVSTLSRQ
jgi:hypothetical protein